MFWRDFGRYGRPWLSAVSDLERLQNEMERVFQGIRRPFAPEFPALNVWTNQDGALVSAELPGVDEKDIDISVTGSTLTLHGKRDASEEGEYHRRERETGAFTRTLDLPFQVEADKVEASFSKGILEIKLPRAEADKPRKISIRSA
jgi:HSP20 family protein